MTAVTYLINLDGSDERLALATRALEAQGLGFERVAAFDGRGVPPASLPGYDEAGALAYMGRTLRGGEIGCYLSHLDCARRFLATGARFAVVLEDDMAPVPGAARVLGEVLDWLAGQPGDWDLCNIGAGKRKFFTPLRDFAGEGTTHVLGRAHYFPMTTTGLIWSREGAGRFVGGHARIDAPVDNHFRRWLTATDRGLAVWPPLVRPTGAESEIDAPGARRKVEGRRPLYGLVKQRRLWGDKARAAFHKLRRGLGGTASGG
ncbi:glycosyltransferase family 25 protein [Rubellimicrobium roseum]|uniref:Glycosyltransferase family 25 protein n=1 Tax=Rubellimicrobium roseum TaxID=687525 RepID=A0A5C4NM32_9RHOB|nr:glycosyltransferase family 25 protein [Rubellimicrobium roseum]TNC74176.1 glycosyltransferase family 25 protein [Rubellimicrobium roseum]